MKQSEPYHGLLAPFLNRKKTIGQCYVGHNVRKGGYVVLRFAEHTMVEPLIDIPENEMESGGVSLILDYLRNPPPSESKPFNMTDNETKKKLLKVKKDCVLIWLSLTRSEPLQSPGSQRDELGVFPMHAGRGWSFQRHASEVRRVQLPITNEQFLQLLRDAFEIAS